MEIITANEYAERLGFNPAYISKKLAAQRKAKQPYKLPGINKITKQGNYWQLSVSRAFDAGKAKEAIKNY